MTKAEIERRKLLNAAVAVLAGRGPTTMSAMRAVVDAIDPTLVPKAIALRERKQRAANEAAQWRGDPPLWAKNLVRKYRPSLDQLYWRRSTVKDSSGGRCFGSRIVVTVGGTDVNEHKVILFHELAHARTLGHGHDDRFWDEQYRLCKAEGLVTRASEREKRPFRAAARRARSAA